MLPRLPEKETGMLSRLTSAPFQTRRRIPLLPALYLVLGCLPFVGQTMSGDLVVT